MFEVNTHGNRHRLTIVATDARSEYRNVMRFDSAKAGKHEDAEWCELMLHDGGTVVEVDWQLVAAMIAKAFKQGLLQPKHVYRVPAWDLMPHQYKQVLFNLFSYDSTGV